MTTKKNDEELNEYEQAVLDSILEQAPAGMREVIEGLNKRKQPVMKSSIRRVAKKLVELKLIGFYQDPGWIFDKPGSTDGGVKLAEKRAAARELGVEKKKEVAAKKAAIKKAVKKVPATPPASKKVASKKVAAKKVAAKKSDGVAAKKSDGAKTTTTKKTGGTKKAPQRKVRKTKSPTTKGGEASAAG